MQRIEPQEEWTQTKKQQEQLSRQLDDCHEANKTAVNKMPSQKMREEYRSFLTEMGQEKTIQTIDHDKSLYHHLCQFIKSQRKQPESFHTWQEYHRNRSGKR